MITYKRELITPQRARQLLAENIENNRKARPTKIAQYARDMASGRWHSNTGETVKVDVKGKVIDGQNRLAAVIMANTDIYLDMAYDVPTDAMQVIDTGAARTAADVLKIAGAADRMTAAAIVRWVILWDARIFVGTGGTMSPTTTEIGDRYLSERERFDAASRRGRDCQVAGLGSGAPAGVAHYLFSRISAEECHQFYDQYILGANLPEKSATLTLRNKMARSRVDRLTRPEQLALFVRGWNAFREDKPLDRMMIVRAGKLSNANFPQPK